MKVPQTGVALENLAQKLKKKQKRQPQYKEGSPTEKVWVNFQTTKEQKRLFAQICKRPPKTIASDFLRDCVELFIKTDGDFAKTVHALKNKKPNKVVEEKTEE